LVAELSRDARASAEGGAVCGDEGGSVNRKDGKEEGTDT
jgi:hypothetical protein